MRRFLSRLAWYFGIASGDPEHDAETREVFVTTAQAVRRGAIAGVLFAVTTSALGGFDDSLPGAVGGGALFGLFMTVFWLFQRSDDEADRRQQKSPR